MLNRIIDKAAAGERLERSEIGFLFTDTPLAVLGSLAHKARLASADPARVTYVKDRNINYTNICVSGCRFCAFYRSKGEEGAYVIERDDLHRKIEEARELGATQILLQGGLHPDLRLDFYTAMLENIGQSFPDIHIHAFSPPEIDHIARIEGLSPEAIIRALRNAGLDSIPGGGAEVLTPDSRTRLSPNKCTTKTWLDVMETAHGLGLKTSATMMFGHGETIEERVDHLLAIRSLQERTGGFTAFIPWSFQPGNTVLKERRESGGHDYLRTVAASRLALDNVANIQASWVTQGDRVAQTALFFGCNDFGSTMIEENVVAAAGVTFRLSGNEIERLIRAAGFRPAQRNQAYEILEDLSR